MKRATQIILVLIVFAMFAKIATVCIDPGFGKATFASCTVPSDWSEEPIEDESGEEDKAIDDIRIWSYQHIQASVPQVHTNFFLPEHDSEVVVPPPQA